MKSAAPDIEYCGKDGLVEVWAAVIEHIIRAVLRVALFWNAQKNE